MCAKRVVCAGLLEHVTWHKLNFGICAVPPNVPAKIQRSFPYSSKVPHCYEYVVTNKSFPQCGCVCWGRVNR